MAIAFTVRVMARTPSSETASTPKLEPRAPTPESTLVLGHGTTPASGAAIDATLDLSSHGSPRAVPAPIEATVQLPSVTGPAGDGYDPTTVLEAKYGATAATAPPLEPHRPTPSPMVGGFGSVTATPRPRSWRRSPLLFVVLLAAVAGVVVGLAIAGT